MTATGQFLWREGTAGVMAAAVCKSLKRPEAHTETGVCLVRELRLSKTYFQKMLKRRVEHNAALTWILIRSRVEIRKPNQEIQAPVWSGTLRDAQV